MGYKLLLVLSIVTACIEILLFAGNFFGWSSLVYVLEKKGYFSYLCNHTRDLNSTLIRTCEEQEASFNLVFTLAASFLLFFTFPSGYVLDKFGTWVFRTIAAFLFTLSYVFFAVSTPETSVLLYPALALSAISGFSLLTSNIQLANLAKSIRGILITFMNGLFDSSVIVYFLFKKVYESGIELHTAFQAMACLTALTWLRTYLFMPKTSIPFPLLTSQMEFGWKEWKCGKENTTEQNDQTKDFNLIAQKNTATSTNNDSSAERPVNHSFTFYLKDPLLWTNIIHFTLLSLRINILFGSVNFWLKSFVDLDEISGLTDAFGIFLMVGLFVSPFNGLIIDFVTKTYMKRKMTQSEINLRASFVSMLITTIFGILLSIMTLIPTAYGTFVMLLFVRSFLYGGAAAFVSINFPSQHFGSLYGFTNFIAGIFGLLQYAFVRLSIEYNPSFYYANIGFLVASIIALVHPLAIYLKIP